MNFKFSIMLFLAILLMGCTSTPKQDIQDRELTSIELNEVVVLGPVQMNFISLSKKLPVENAIKNRAYSGLLEEAKRNYSGEIDIRNIIITLISVERKTFPGPVFINEYSYASSGVVVSINNTLSMDSVNTD